MFEDRVVVKSRLELEEGVWYMFEVKMWPVEVVGIQKEVTVDFGMKEFHCRNRLSRLRVRVAWGLIRNLSSNRVEVAVPLKMMHRCKWIGATQWLDVMSIPIVQITLFNIKLVPIVLC